MPDVPIMRLLGVKKYCRDKCLLPLVLLIPLVVCLSTVPARAQPTFELDDYDEPHSRCGSLGVSLGKVDGLSGDLAVLTGSSDGVIVLEWTQNEYLTPYTSIEYQLSLNLLNNFSILQVAYGRRWSTVPFPKVLLRPWVGLYVTGDFLEDDRHAVYQEYEEADGLGAGLAAAVGLSLRVTRTFALELAVKADTIFIFGQLETGELFGDRFEMYGVYLRLMFIE
jgi:hypothetical protein